MPRTPPSSGAPLVARRSTHRLRRRTQTVSHHVEEAYLREDIACGVEGCAACALDGVAPASPADPAGALARDATHHLVPDAAALVEYLDVLERLATRDCVLLGSEVKAAIDRHGHDPRVRRAIRDVARRRRGSWRLFPDDHFAPTSRAAWRRRVPFGALPADAEALAARDAHAVVRFAVWFAEHLERGHRRRKKTTTTSDDGASSASESPSTSESPTVVILSDRLADPAEASRLGLPPRVAVRSAEAYFPTFRAGDADALAAFESVRAAREETREAASGTSASAPTTTSEGGSRFRFPAHLTARELADGVDAGALIEGTVRVDPRDPSRATLDVTSVGGDAADVDAGAGAFDPSEHAIAIPTRLARNRAFDGDVVAARMRPRSEWVEDDRERTVGPASRGDDDDEDDDAGDGDDAGDDDAGDGDYAGDGDDAGDGVSEDVSEARASRPSRRLRPTADVVGILRHRASDFVATVAPADAAEALAASDSNRPRAALLIPSDRRAPRMRLVTRRAAQLAGLRVLARPERPWPAHARRPDARVVRVLGPAGDLDAEVRALLAAENIPDAPFTNAAASELERVLRGVDPRAWTPPADREFRRRDFRDVAKTYSVDPPGCVDVDDAVSVRGIRSNGLRTDSNGVERDDADAEAALRERWWRGDALGPAGFAFEGEDDEAASRDASTADFSHFEIAVHIADVTWFVRPGGALDAEAFARGTTVYLANRRVDMLPAALSEVCASLLEGRDRFAVTCAWLVRAKDFRRVGAPWFGRTRIRNRAQLDYYAAQALRDSKNGIPPDASFGKPSAEDPRKTFVDVLFAFAEALRRDRGATRGDPSGASTPQMELESAELRFETTADGAPAEVLVKGEVPAMRVVAELMIAANAATATRVERTLAASAFVRRHAPPKREGVEALRTLARELVAPRRRAEEEAPRVDASTGAAFERSLRALVAYVSREDREEDEEASGVGARVERARRRASDASSLIRGLASRAMSEARYCATGEAPPADGGGFAHFGLALERYTHFTSPIRRFADVVAHRQLLACLATEEKAEADASDAVSASDASASRASARFSEDSVQSEARLLSRANVVAQAAHLNERTSASKRAQRRCAELFLLHLLRRAPIAERATIVALRDDGVVAFVPRFQVRVRVRLAPEDGRGAVVPSAATAVETRRGAVRVGSNEGSSGTNVANASEEDPGVFFGEGSALTETSDAWVRVVPPSPGPGSAPGQNPGRRLGVRGGAERLEHLRSNTFGGFGRT